MNCLFYINKDFLSDLVLNKKIKMTPISAQERTKKYRSMMPEQNKRTEKEKG